MAYGCRSRPPSYYCHCLVVTIRTLGSKEVTMQNACENELKTTTQAIHVFSVFLRLIRFNIRNLSV